MRTVYLVTHPEATHHVENLVGGWYDSELTARGLRAAGAIADVLHARIPAGCAVEVHSSDLRRTRQTAEVVGERLGVEVRLDQGLRELSYGEAEGRPQAWLAERYLPPPPVGDRMHHDHGVPGAETKWSLVNRVYASVDAILRSDCEHQVLVTHGGAATFVVAAWIGMPPEATGYVNVRVTPGGISELREDDFFHGRQIASLDDTGHLVGVL
ncbi:MAG TPA: histidine phosphatase family protein [Nocardioidaceae bacterium]